jgi:hypothetical protein
MCHRRFPLRGRSEGVPCIKPCSCMGGGRRAGDVTTERRVWRVQVLQLEAQLSSLSKSPLPRSAASIVDKARSALNAGQ